MNDEFGMGRRRELAPGDGSKNHGRYHGFYFESSRAGAEVLVLSGTRTPHKLFAGQA